MTYQFATEAEAMAAVSGTSRAAVCGMKGNGDMTDLDSAFAVAKVLGVTEPLKIAYLASVMSAVESLAFHAGKMAGVTEAQQREDKET